MMAPTWPNLAQNGHKMAPGVVLGLSWRRPGAVLGSSWGRLGIVLVVLGPSWGRPTVALDLYTPYALCRAAACKLCAWKSPGVVLRGASRSSILMAPFGYLHGGYLSAQEKNCKKH